MSTKKAKRKKKTLQKPPILQKSLKRGSSNLTSPNLQPQSKMQQTKDTYKTPKHRIHRTTAAVTIPVNRLLSPPLYRQIATALLLMKKNTMSPKTSFVTIPMITV